MLHQTMRGISATNGLPSAARSCGALAFCLGACLPLFFTAAPAAVQSPTVALTFDDLPAAATGDPAEAESFNRAILDSLAKHHAPAIGFVIEKKVVELGSKEILEQWVRRGFDLGNHTFSHADLNNLTLEQFKQEVISGEASFALTLAGVNKTPRFLRFPYSHTGDTAAKHAGVAAFLKERGYQVATCTIDNEDFLFNEAYLRMLARKDDESAVKLRAAYLAYTAAEIDYYTRLHKRVFGRPIPHVMLFHVNRLNANLMDQLLGIFEAKHYSFVSLDAAQSDPAYKTPDTFTTSFGPMWGYRWAKERGVAVDGSLESEPPAWISQYASAGEK
jgi:peptidoglycan/xylan/chitin deacetylase (PgdA/CDA1 family)